MLLARSCFSSVSLLGCRTCLQKTPGSLKKELFVLRVVVWLKKLLASVLLMCVFSCPLQLYVIAFDNGDPVKTNSTLVEITVLQPSRIPIFTQEEYRYISLTQMLMQLLLPVNSHIKTQL